MSDNESSQSDPSASVGRSGDLVASREGLYRLALPLLSSIRSENACAHPNYDNDTRVPIFDADLGVTGVCDTPVLTNNSNLYGAMKFYIGTLER